MKTLRFLLLLLVTVGTLYALDTRWGEVPPLGAFLDPTAGFWQNAETNAGDPPQGRELGALREEVRVVYDSLRIPHVYASNERDLFFMQGYLTARARLFQMDFLTRAAAGRISEVVGAEAVDFDRQQRRKGLLRGARNVRDSMKQDPRMKAVVSAYTAGVNAHIRSLGQPDLPVEYKLLDVSPTPWTPLRTALLLQYMSDDLSGRDQDLENTNALRMLGAETFDLLFPEVLPGNDPIVPAEKEWGFDPRPVDAPAQPLRSRYLPHADTLGDAPGGIGSNNWAVSGDRTASGTSMLASDPHLSLSFPSIWYGIHLHGPDMNVMGVSLPGAPGVIIGFNESVAWGVTNADWDTRDWYRIQYRNENKQQYKFGDRWRRVQETVDTIQVRNAPTVYDTVRHTHHGPVVFDRAFPGEQADPVGYALRWPVHDASNEVRAFYEINKADDYREFRDALRHYARPAQNFAVATASDTIGMRVQGKFPRKWEEQGRFLMDGSRPVNEWAGWIPFAHNPHVVNPDAGFVSSANQHPVESSYPYYVSGGEGYYRAKRINAVLGRNDNLTPADMKALQNDVLGVKARMVLPLMLERLSLGDPNAAEARALDRLRNWDYRYEPDKTAPVIFELWWKELYQTLWDEFGRDSVPLPVPHSANTIHLMKQGKGTAFYDRADTPETEGLTDLIRGAYRRAVDSLRSVEAQTDSSASWWRFKGTSIRHLLRIPSFGQQNTRIGGDQGIVNAAGSRAAPSWRMVVELGEEIRAWGVFPGGQSGNPGSPYYDHMVDEWAEGDYFRLIFEPEDSFPKDAIFRTVTFEPGES